MPPMPHTGANSSTRHLVAFGEEAAYHGRVRRRLDALSRTRSRTILGAGIVVYVALLGALGSATSGGGRLGVAAGSLLVITTALPAVARLEPIRSTRQDFGRPSRL